MNKVLNDAQDQAVIQYCLSQWEIGLGATHDMVYAVICHLKQVCYYILYVSLLIIADSISESKASHTTMVPELVKEPRQAPYDQNEAYRTRTT
jgi:hypothetical protein